jgi:hypothetical protein
VHARKRRGLQKQPRTPDGSTRLVVGADYQIDGHAKGQKPHYGMLQAISWRDGHIWLRFKIIPDDSMYDLGAAVLHISQANISNIRLWDRVRKDTVRRKSRLDSFMEDLGLNDAEEDSDS